MNSMPPEIISEIFLLSLREGEQRTPHEMLHLTQVCGRWREIASTTPSLWTHLNVSTSSRADPIFHPKFVQSWARKSANLMVHLRLRQGQGIINVEADSEDIISFLMCIGQKLATFEMKFPLLCLGDALTRLPSGISLSRLRCIKISMNKHFDTLSLNNISSISSNSPSLTSIDGVNGHTINLLLTLNMFHWHQLTELSIDEESLELSAIRKILFGCRNLVTLKIRTLSNDFVGLNPPSGLPGPVQTLPYLTFLSCSLTGDEDCMTLFQPFDFPRLASLDFVTVGNAMPALLMLRERTPFPLTRVALAHCPDITSAEMCLFFSECSSIEELDLCDSFDTSWFNSDLMKALTYEPGGRNLLLPQLHKLTLDIAFHREDYTLNTLYLQLEIAKMISSRWSIHPLPRRWTQVSASFSAGEELIRCISPLVFDIYRRCMAQGMSLELIYYPYEQGGNASVQSFTGGSESLTYVLSLMEAFLSACILIPIFTYCLLQVVYNFNPSV
ncbi:hypothetical protein VKT23_000272 [Stygiomarasmius scandens]|uniref:F-box domain-containing protein n=1 Tax=Marasmiellus scandens TaxID=2682957 RepID=A0ABR1K646_9AGAR